jgi:hypothetical protein
VPRPGHTYEPAVLIGLAEAHYSGQVQYHQAGALKAQPDEFSHIYRETLEQEWPGQIVLVGASPRRIKMNNRESSTRSDGGGLRRGHIGQTALNDAGQTGERHVAHRNVDRRAIVVDSLNVAARFRIRVRHLANAGE